MTQLQQYICEHCHTAFERPARRHYRYCSSLCYHAAQVGTSRGTYTTQPHQPIRIIRVCMWCGQEFESVSSAGARISFCSRSCQAYAHTKLPLCKALSATDAAYLAGILDGEGYIGIHDRRSTRPRSSRPSICVDVGNTSRELIDWLHRVTGTGTITGDRLHPDPKNKPMWYWRVGSLSALSVLQQALPYMLIKQGQALAAIVSQSGADRSPSSPKPLDHLSCESPNPLSLQDRR